MTEANEAFLTMTGFTREDLEAGRVISPSVPRPNGPTRTEKRSSRSNVPASPARGKRS